MVISSDPRGVNSVVPTPEMTRAGKTGSLGEGTDAVPDGRLTVLVVADCRSVLVTSAGAGCCCMLLVDTATGAGAGAAG